MNETSARQRVADYVIAEQQKLYRLAYGYVKNKEDALDVVQDSILKAMTALDSLKNPDHVKTWMYRIVVNTALDLLRRQQRLSLADFETLERLSPGEEDRYENLDLQTAMEALPANCQTVIRLRFFEDMKIEEIARVVDSNVNTVKTWLYKGLEKLRMQMEEPGEEWI